MRLLPTVLIILLAVFGVALGLSVMWGGSSGGRSAPVADVAGGVVPTDGSPGSDGKGQGVAVGRRAQMPAFLGDKPQGHIYTGALGEPSDVNPFTTHDPIGQRLVLSFTHDSLLDRDPATGRLRSALASAYEVGADGLSCTFTLRDGVQFSDGQLMTMADVLFGWQLAEAGHLELGFVSSCYRRISAAEALDDRHLRVRFGDRHFAAVGTVGLGWIVAQKQFFVDRVRERLDPGEAMPEVASARFAALLGQVDQQCGPGTGPFELQNDPGGVSNWQRRQSMELTRNAFAWRRALRPGTWNFGGMRILFRDQAGARNALLRGEVDWYSGAQLDQLLANRAELSDRYQKLVYDYPELGCYRIVWNTELKPFDDPRVRRAMSMLVNRQEVLEVFAGAARVATAHAKIGSPAYPDVQPLSFDPKAARRLLREAGFDPAQGKPLRMTLLTYNGSEPARRVLELFASSAKQAGIDLEVHARESAAFVAEKKYRAWHGYMALQYFDTWGDPHRFLHSEGRDNDGRWQHRDADRLIEAAQIELDDGKRSALWRELHELAHLEQPATLVVHPLASMLLNRSIEDCAPGPLGLRPYRAWVAPELQRR